MRDAASAAGLTVRRIINRPTSACIAYGLDKETLYRAAADWAPWGRAVVVVDVLGGFEEEVQAEVSLLDIDDGVFEILSRRERRIEVGSATLVPMLEEVLHEANTSASRVDDWLFVHMT